MPHSKSLKRKLVLTPFLGVVFLCQVAILSFVDFTTANDLEQAVILSPANSLLGTVLTLPDTLIDVYSGEQTQAFSDSEVKLRVLALLALRCAQCMEDLDKWSEFEGELRERSGLADEGVVDFVFVVDGPTRKYASYMLSRQEFDYPVLFDSAGVIVNMNELHGAPAAYLLDERNRVLEVGIPVAQPLVKEAYLNSASTFLTR